MRNLEMITINCIYPKEYGSKSSPKQANKPTKQKTDDMSSTNVVFDKFTNTKPVTQSILSLKRQQYPYYIGYTHCQVIFQ